MLTHVSTSGPKTSSFRLMSPTVDSSKTLAWINNPYFQGTGLEQTSSKFQKKSPF